MDTIGAKAQQGVQGVEVGLRIAYTVADAGRAMTLSDIAKASGLAPSKVHRYLVSLIRARLIEQNKATNRYDLGEAALAVGLASLRRLDSYRLCDETMQRIYDEIGVGVSAMIWGNIGPTVVRRIEVTDQVMLVARLGSSISIVASAAGRVFAAYLPSHIVDPKVDAEFSSGRNFTSMGRPISRSDFRTIVEAVRREGIAVVHGDFLKGFDAIAAPVFNHEGNLAMTISIVSPEGIDLSPAGRPQRVLAAEAAALSRRLGAPEEVLPKPR